MRKLENVLDYGYQNYFNNFIATFCFLSRGLNGFPYILLCGILTCFFTFGLIYAIIVINNSKVEEDNKRYMSQKKSGKYKPPTKKSGSINAIIPLM